MADIDLASIKEHYEEQGSLTGEELDVLADIAVGIVRDILEAFGEDQSTIDEYEGSDGELILDINGGSLASLIGRHGRVLDALQMVVTSMLNARLQFHFPVVVDIEGYKNRRKQKLVHIAHSSAERCLQTGQKVVLAPMPAFERRIIHIALSQNDAISTYSEGEDPNRRIVIIPV